jgi:predicted transposase/invertase (TIGR01784 family)
MQRYLDPTNDVAFKKLFSDKVKLIDLLNCVLGLPEGLRIKDLEYIPTEQMPLYLDGKRSIFDLKVKDESGRWYIVEMQRKTEKDYLNRAQYYGCYSYISQLEEGIAHKDLLPVVVVSIIGSRVFSDELPCINYHHLKETTTKKQYLFSLTYVFIELGKFNEKEIKNDTDEWLHFLKCAAKEQEPPKEITNEKVLSAYNEVEQYKWTAAEHDAYIRSRLAQEAEEEKEANMLESIEARYEEGMAKGIAEGEAKGCRKNHKIYQTLKRQNYQLKG